MVDSFAKLELRLLLLREVIRAKLGIVKRPGSRQRGPYELQREVGDNNAHGIAMAAIIKNEGNYLAEWLEFHVMLGVRHIYLYDNGSTDNTPDVLKPYIRDQLVTIMPWPNFSATLRPQSLAYSHALASFGAAYEWMVFIDIDEFVYPVKDQSLNEAMSELSHLPGVNLPWICFGPSGHQKRPEGLVIKNFTERGSFPPREDQYRLIKHKTIVNPRKITGGTWPHYFHSKEDGPILINDRGEKFPPHRAKDLKYSTADRLRLHHYFTRSYEELERKLKRGRLDRLGGVHMGAQSGRLKQYLLYTEQDTVMTRFIPELERRLAQRYGRKIELVDTQAQA
jgi:hypothetical protein